MLASESKYLDFAEALDKVRAQYQINPAEWKTLRTIARYHLKGAPVKTIDLLHMQELASPATIHKMIKNLIAKGMVSIHFDDRDGRLKFLVPTTKALNTFKQLSGKMAGSK